MLFFLPNYLDNKEGLTWVLSFIITGIKVKRILFGILNKKPINVRFLVWDFFDI